jgi:hypothetical protein
VLPPRIYTVAGLTLMAEFPSLNQVLCSGNRRLEFEAWLIAAGAEILRPTNEWEVLRIRANAEVSVAYRNKLGTLSVVGSMINAAYSAWRMGKPWSGADKKPRPKSGRRRRYVTELLLRDGPLCFYCPTDVSEEATIEHMVPVAHGGPSHLSNLVLACVPCNRDAGHLSVAEKVRRRDAMRAAGSAHASDRTLFARSA